MHNHDGPDHLLEGPTATHLTSKALYKYLLQPSVLSVLQRSSIQNEISLYTTSHSTEEKSLEGRDALWEERTIAWKINH